MPRHSTRNHNGRSPASPPKFLRMLKARTENLRGKVFPKSPAQHQNGITVFQRVAFGPLSDFLAGLGSHLTDMNRTELITLLPLAVLIVVLGLFPSLVLDLLRAPAQAFLTAAAAVGR